MSEELYARRRGFYKAAEDGRLYLANREALALQNKNYEVQLDAEQVQTNETMYVADQAQKLTEEEIRNLAAQKNNPQDIIGTLVANNANFEKRSEFSKQKYLEKKQKKYNLILKIEHVDLLNLNRHFCLDKKDHVFNRDDYFAYLLNHFQVRETDQVFVAERARGLVMAGVLKKFHGMNDFKVWAWSSRGKPLDVSRFDAVRYLGQGQAFKNNVLGAESDAFAALKLRLTAAVIATDEAELQILDSLEGKLAYNARVVLFTNYYEVAAAVYEHMASKGHYINLLMNDYLFREMQAWPMRSHPTMIGNTCAGYFVTGINVNPAEK